MRFFNYASSQLCLIIIKKDIKKYTDRETVNLNIINKIKKFKLDEIGMSLSLKIR